MLQSIEGLRSILIVGSRDSDTERLIHHLPPEQYTCELTDSVDKAAMFVEQNNFDAALIEIDFPRFRSIQLLQKIRRECPTMKVIMMTDYGDDELWVKVVNEGASDLVLKPVSMADVAHCL